MTAPRIGAFLSIAVTWTTVGYSAEAVDLKQRFLNEYPAASKKLRQFYGRVQMVVIYTMDASANGEVQQRYRDEYATNRRHLLRKTIVEVSKFEKTGFERVAVANPKRSSFSLQRTNPDGDYVLTGMDEYRDVSSSILFYSRPLTATFGYYETTLWRSLHDELVANWKVTEVVEEGQRLARVTWTEKPDKEGNWQSGDVLVAPSRSWAILEFSLNGTGAKATRPGSALSGTVKYEGEIDGVPLIKTVSFWNQKYDKRGKVERRWNVETYDVLSLKTERLPLSNFSMAAFGLSDPREHAAEKPTRWWLWAMAAGAGALVCAVGFSWLRRRASR